MTARLLTLASGAGGSGRCDSELPAHDAVEHALAEEAREERAEEAGVALPSYGRVTDTEPYGAEVDLPFHITAWRDAAREKGATSTQARELYAGMMDLIREGKAAARAEGNSRSLALLKKYETSLTDKATRDAVVVYGLDFKSGEMNTLPARRGGR